MFSGSGIARCEGGCTTIGWNCDVMKLGTEKYLELNTEKCNCVLDSKQITCLGKEVFLLDLLEILGSTM